MEVLRTGDELEKQILEDARAKASRILAEAERDSAAIREEWLRKTEAERSRLEADRAARIAAVRQELAASLPLDFMRARLSYIQDMITSALRDYFASLTPPALARIIGGLLSRIPPVLHGAAVVVSALGMRGQEARRIVQENVAGVQVETVKEIETQPGQDPDSGLVLETTDGRIRFRGTLRELGAQLLEQHREELAEALLGRDV